MKCRNCAAENPVGVEVCQFCGSELPKPNQTVINQYYGFKPGVDDNEEIVRLEIEERKRKMQELNDLTNDVARAKKISRISYIVALALFVAGMALVSLEKAGDFPGFLLIVAIVLVVVGFKQNKKYKRLKEERDRYRNVM